MATPSTTSSGTKRKRGTELKFYAVREGHKPGIYHSWADCKEQITFFKGAVYKSFTSLGDAEAFCKGEETYNNANGTPKKFYAVQVGKEPGVYNDWPSAQAQIKGWPKPKHKSFPTRAEAEAFVREGAREASNVFPAAASVADSAPQLVKYESSLADVDTPLPKKTKSSKLNQTPQMPSGPGFDYLSPEAEDGFDRRIIMDPESGDLRYKEPTEASAMKMMPRTHHMGEMLNIWTDGACTGNGQGAAIGGVGVYFGPNDPRNIGEPLLGRQTNQRAELTALKRALNIAPINRGVTIYSDSMYAINCVTKWFQKWQTNNWKNAQKKDVENKDIIQDILEILNNRHLCRSTTDFKWVKGHSGNAENEAADRLAVQGAEENKAKKISTMTHFRIPSDEGPPMGKVDSEGEQWTAIGSQEDDGDEFVDAQEDIAMK